MNEPIMALEEVEFHHLSLINNSRGGHSSAADGQLIVSAFHMGALVFRSFWGALFVRLQLEARRCAAGRYSKLSSRSRCPPPPLFTRVMDTMCCHYKSLSAQQCTALCQVRQPLDTSAGSGTGSCGDPIELPVGRRRVPTGRPRLRRT